MHLIHPGLAFGLKGFAGKPGSQNRPLPPHEEQGKEFTIGEV